MVVPVAQWAERPKREFAYDKWGAAGQKEKRSQEFIQHDAPDVHRWIDKSYLVGLLNATSAEMAYTFSFLRIKMHVDEMLFSHIC